MRACAVPVRSYFKNSPLSPGANAVGQIVKRALAIGVLLLVAASSRAADTELRYLPPDAIHPIDLLPPPPTVGSEEYKAEIKQILALQNLRSESQRQHFQVEEKLGLTAFAGVMPGFCTADRLPKLDKLLNGAINDAKYFGQIAKDHFQRKRPYWTDDRLQPLGARDEECSYPSGHAMRGILCATILAQLDPSRSDPLMERGREIGWDRVIGGVHYPSDIAAGRVLGQAVAQALLKNPDFLADLKEVEEEYESCKKSDNRRPPGKSEIRNPKSETNHKSEQEKRKETVSAVPFSLCFGFWILDFGFSSYPEQVLDVFQLC